MRLRIAENERLRGALCRMVAGYVRLVLRSAHFQHEGGDAARALWRDGKPFVIAFWHGRLLCMSGIWPDGKPISMLVSEHRDGQLIARAIAHLGVGSVPGSTTRGGTAGLRGLLKLLKADTCVGITPDGPRGPRMRVASDGVIAAARLAGVPVIPASFSASHAVILGSWDRFMVPLPFTRGVFLWGEPILVARDADSETREAARLRLESALNDLTAEADRRMGRPAIEPADARP
ncbi:MAG: lysophospholipid acyltransferase family protein [Alphaproteobacteria bacterium]|nr:lysophospholipid acyltransferase family protein [Alphaproteobacteria bacterium]